MGYFKCVDKRDQSVLYFELNKSLLSIGSKEGNDILLPSSDIQATHANLLKKESGFQINLLDRKAKLYLNKNPIRRGVINIGDTLDIATFRLTLHEGNPPKEEQRKELESLEKLVQFSSKLMEN